jgi:hypothetical protein
MLILTNPAIRRLINAMPFPFHLNLASYSFFPANKMVKIIIAITAMNAIKGTAM